MPAQRKDLTIDRGTTFLLSLQYIDSDDKPVDLTGHLARLKLDDYRGTTVGTYTATVDDAGHVDFNVSSAITALLKPERHDYYISVTSPNGNITGLLFGVINVRSGLL